MMSCGLEGNGPGRFRPIDNCFLAKQAQGLGAFVDLAPSTYMSFVLEPWQFLLIILAGWINRQQQALLDFQRLQIEALLKQLGKKRILLSDDQRKLLAVKGKAIGRKALKEVSLIVTPDTILRWHWKLVAQKWDYTERRKTKPGRPSVSAEIKKLVVKMAKENPSWGYDRIVGALANLGHEISDSSVGNILRDHGIQPAPERKRQTSWKTFLKAHWETLGSIDFTTIEVWTKNGLVTFYLLFVMELASRRVRFAGCTTSPNELWMKQIARNLTDSSDGFLLGKHQVLLDRDTKYCESFVEILNQAEVECLRLPPQSPNLNAHLERFIRSIKEECLERMIFFGEQSLRSAVTAYLEHYHAERNHQGLANKLIQPSDEVGQVAERIECRERLGGMLKYYYRSAA